MKSDYVKDTGLRAMSDAHSITLIWEIYCFCTSCLFICHTLCPLLYFLSATTVYFCVEINALQSLTDWHKRITITDRPTKTYNNHWQFDKNALQSLTDWQKRITITDRLTKMHYNHWQTDKNALQSLTDWQKRITITDRLWQKHNNHWQTDKNTL